MAINTSYVRPQSLVFQFLDYTVRNTGDHLGTLIIGELYDLYRYGKEVTTGVPATGDATLTIPLNYDREPLNDYIVDKESVLVLGEDLLATCCSPTSLTAKVSSTNYLALKTEKVISVASKEYASLLDSAMHGYAIQIGDIINVRDTASNERLATVVGLIGKETSGIVSTTLFVGVILDTCPYDISSMTTTSTYTITKVYKKYTGLMPIYAVTNSDVLVSNTLVIKGAKADGSDLSAVIDTAGYLYPEFRVKVLPPVDEEVLEFSNTADVLAILGTIDVNNELAYGVQCALDGANGRPVKAVRVREHTAEGFLDAAKKTDADPSIYSVVPLVNGDDKDNDLLIVEAIARYNNEKSSPYQKMWRQTIVGVDTPGEYEVKFISSDNNTASYTIKFAEAYTGEAAATGSCTLCQLDSANCSFKRVNIAGVEGELRAGDYIKVGEAKYQIKLVLADNLIKLVNGPAAKASVTSVVLWKADTVANNDAFVGGLGLTLGTRRGVVVWCDNGTKNGTVISNMYLAAEIAGLCSAVIPQLPITMTEIRSITACTRMYTRYTLAQLDHIAALGVLIVTQDNKNVDPYIRHLLTTDATHGTLYSEMSVTRNVDNISYAIADVVNGFTGKANVSEPAIAALKAAVISKLTSFTLNSVDNLIGPSLVSYSPVLITQDDTLEDWVNISTTYYVPVPMNGIRAYLSVVAARLGETAESINA